MHRIAGNELFLSSVKRGAAKMFCLQGPQKAQAGSDCMCGYGCGYADLRATVAPHDDFRFFVAPIKVAQAQQKGIIAKKVLAEIVLVLQIH
jgi:hypothetical protein